jgi:hypothetical protein
MLMPMKIERILVGMFLVGLLANEGFAQNVGPGSKPSVPVYPDASGGRDHLVLTPNLAGATQDDGRVIIPFYLKNNSDQNAEIACTGYMIDGLAIVDKAGEIRFIQNLYRSGNGHGKSGPSVRIALRPGEATPYFCSVYSLATLRAVAGQKIFGVLEGFIENPAHAFISYSAPFVVPPALTSLPWIDLGAENYLSVMPDGANLYFQGGDFPSTTVEGQRADPRYADWIKNGWTQDISIPFTIRNISNQDLVVAVDGIRYYIMGDEKARNSMMQGGGWYLVKMSAPVLKPGESILSNPFWELSSLEDKGYKPGDKIVAVAYGRIANTNKIFQCYSAPFELPPLPRSQPGAIRR